jgi:uncharacterized metal-binding protein
MRTVLKPLPLLYACAGCPAHGQLAREVGKVLDRRGLAEMTWLGAGTDAHALAAKALSRWPVFAFDGCADACAKRWLEKEGIAAQRCFILAQMDGTTAEALAERLAADF